MDYMVGGYFSNVSILF